MSDELYHHGIKGQKWGVRRYQNPDGTLTKAGVQRYRRATKKYSDQDREQRFTRALMSRAYYKDALGETPSKKYQRGHDRAVRSFKRTSNKDAKRFAKSVGMSTEEAKDFLDQFANMKVKDRKKINVNRIAGKKITESAVDDMISVMSGTKSRRSFNSKYRGTGYRMV